MAKYGRTMWYQHFVMHWHTTERCRRHSNDFVWIGLSSVETVSARAKNWSLKWENEKLNKKIRRNSKWSVISILVRENATVLFWSIIYNRFRDMCRSLISMIICTFSYVKYIVRLFTWNVVFKAVLMWMRRRPNSLAMKIEYWKIIHDTDSYDHLCLLTCGWHQSISYYFRHFHSLTLSAHWIYVV